MKRYVPARGDIAWIDFSPQAGHEQANRRPSLVLSPKEYNAATGLAVACPISNKEKGYRFEVKLPMAIQTRGVVISDHIRSLDWRVRNAEFKEFVPEEIVFEVLARIAALLSF